MEDKFQQLYDYMNSAGLIQEGVTPESFKNMYVSGEKNISDLFQVMSIRETPFEVGNLNEFSEGFFGVKKKEETQPTTPPEESSQVYPSVRPSTAASSRSAQMGEQETGGLGFTVRPGLFGIPDIQQEEQFLKGTVGDVVNSIPFIGGAIDDMARSIATGYSNVNTMDEARFMFSNPSEESVKTFYDAMMKHQLNVQEYGESEEMKAFMTDAKKYISEGNQFGGFKALAQHPSAAFEFMLQSAIGLMDPEAIKEGVKVFTTGVVGGTVMGTAVPGVGNVAGAITGAGTSMPFAMAAASREVEVLMSSIEFLNEELEKDGLDFNPENILAVLSDDEKYKSIRNRSAVRANTIMGVDAALGSLFGSAMRAVKVAGKASDAAITAATVGVDVISGGGSEMLARELAGQEQDPLEIALEAGTGPVTQTPSTLATTYAGIRAEKMKNNKIVSNTPKKYFFGDSEIDAEGLVDFVETATNEQLLNSKIRVENDPRMDGYLEAKIERAQIEESIPANIQGETRDKLVELETRLKRLEGNTTRSGEINRKAYQEEIDSLIENYKEVTPEEKNVIQGDPNKIFSGEPVSIVKKSSQDYAKVSGIEITEGENITQLDVNNAKAIADAFDQMEHKPDDPEVMASYEAMAKETLDQYSVLQKNGVKVIIYEGKGEPYKNSAEMLKDLRENNRIFILSTEKDFGTSGITDQQRAENPLLADSGLKDYNGKPLLVNDVFRAVHDFFGHGERGNSFGAIGEENAWDVHARMYSPLARRAMTTETRGQNSWVNFGPQMRNEQGDIIKEGDEGYLKPSDRSFAPQKIGLLPEEMSEPGQGRISPEQKEQMVAAAEEQGAVMSESERVGKAQELSAKAREEGVYVKKNYARNITGFKEFSADVLKGRTAFQRRWTKARKFMPSSMFAAAEGQEAAVAAHMNVVQNHAKALGRIEASVPANQREQFISDFDTYLRGGEPGNLSPEAIALANSMRTNIDNLSMRLINEGVVAPSQIDNVISNLGEYMNRSYRLYDTKDWREQLQTDEGQGIVNRAKNWLRSNDRQLIQDAEKDYLDPTQNPQNLSLEAFIEERIEGKINALLDKGGNSFAANPKLSTKDLSILKQRKEIPLEIAALMGEYTDPLQNYAQTVLKLAQLNEANTMLQKVKQSGMGVYLFDKPTGPFSVQIASEGSVSKSPLNGLYTTPEIAKEFNEAGSTEGIKGPAMTVIDQAFKFWLGTAGAVKWAKTIGSVGTHMKNVFGNLGFMAANGHTDLSMLRATYETIKNDLGDMSDEEANARMEKYISLGIVKQNVGLGEIRDMLGKGAFDDVAASRLDEKSKKIWEVWKGEKFKNAKKWAEDMYQAEDDFFKIVAYENEVNRYSQAEYGVDPSKLTEQQRLELDTKVAEIVKNTYPTYSRTPEVVRLLKVNPVIGNFVSFQAESYRTAWNIVNQARQELSSNNPDIRAIGAKRLSGITLYQGAKTAVIGAFGYGAGAGMTGAIGAAMSSETEQERDADVRKFLPPWAVNSSIIINNMSDGKFSYVNFSASDPFGGIDQVVNAVSSGEDPIQAFAKGVKAIVEPFVGVDIATRRFSNVINNTDDYGKQVWNPEAKFEDQTADILAYMYKIFEPGTATSVRKVITSDDPVNEAIGQATGMKNFDVDVSEQFSFMMKALGDRMRDARNIRYEDYAYGSYNFKPASVSQANEALMNVEAEVYQLYRSAERLGVDPAILKDHIINFGGVSKDRASKIVAGQFEQLSDIKQ